MCVCLLSVHVLYLKIQVWIETIHCNFVVYQFDVVVFVVCLFACVGMCVVVVVAFLCVLNKRKHRSTSKHTKT